MDRLITITLGHYDRATEIAITVAKSGIPEPDAQAVVDLVRELRGVGVNNHRPTLRACVAIARILAHKKARAREGDPIFRLICRDVLNTDTAKVTCGGESLMPHKVDEAIRKVCGPRPGRPGARVGGTRSGRKE